MIEEIDDSSSSSTEPPSVDAKVPVRTLAPLFIHRRPVPPPQPAPTPPTQHVEFETPRSLVLVTPKPSVARRGSTRRHHTPSTIYSMTRHRSMFLEETPERIHFPAEGTIANPMALHLARRQKQAARIMATGGDSADQLLPPCRLDLKYKSPRRLRQAFRQRSGEWKSEYLNAWYYPVEVTKELSHWLPEESGQTEPLVKLVAMESPQRPNGTACCSMVKRLYRRRRSTAEDVSTLEEVSVRPSPNRNKGFTDEELAWAMKRFCRVRKPWPTIVDKVRASRAELRFAGVKLLAGLLEARSNGNIAPEHAHGAIRSMCYNDDQSSLEWIKRRNDNEPCVPDWVLQSLMPLIAPLFPSSACRIGLLSADVEAAREHLQTLSDNSLQEVQNSLGHLNLNQLTHIRMTLPAKPSDGSLHKARIKDLVRSCEQHIGDKFWQFLSGRVRPSTQFYETLLHRANDALLDHPVKSDPVAGGSALLPFTSSAVSSSVHGFTSLEDPSPGRDQKRPFVEVPKLKPSVRQQLGLVFLDTMGALELTPTLKTEILEQPVSTLSDMQSWWLIFTADITRRADGVQTPPKSPMNSGHSSLLLDIVGENFSMCFLRLPALELRFARPSGQPAEEVFTINELVAADVPGGTAVWALRAIPPEVLDLAALAPRDPTRHLASLTLNEAFQRRRAVADAHTLTANVDSPSPVRGSGQGARLRSVSRTRSAVLRSLTSNFQRLPV